MPCCSIETSGGYSGLIGSVGGNGAGGDGFASITEGPQRAAKNCEISYPDLWMNQGKGAIFVGAERELLQFSALAPSAAEQM